MKIKMTILLALLLCLPLSVSAEVRRGDSGEEVRELQSYLLAEGLLTSQPDGIFGAQTETAVMNYQASQGLPQTGIADDALMERLRGTPENVPAKDAAADQQSPADAETPDHCRAEDEDGKMAIHWCAAHQELLSREKELSSAEGTDYEAVRSLWETEIERMYGDWLAGSAPEEKLDILAAYSSWSASLQSQDLLLQKLYSDDPGQAGGQLVLFLKDHAALLCRTINESAGKAEGGAAE